MNAKDKEKKAIVNAFLGKEADILVVDPIRYRQLADIKKRSSTKWRKIKKYR